MSDQPTDLWVGPRQVRWWDEPVKCTHADRNVCPGCTEMTAEEAAAVREYVDRLRAAAVGDGAPQQEKP